MKYSKARDLFFNYFLMQKELNIINNDIRHYQRNMPIDNGPASEFTMSLMDIEIDKRDKLKNEMEKSKEEIELILKVFK